MHEIKKTSGGEGMIPTKTLEELSNRFDEIISRLRFPGYFKLTENDVEQLRKEKNGVWVPEDVFRQKLRKERKKFVEIEKNTRPELWKEGARWCIKFIDEVLAELEPEEAKK